MSKAGLPKKLKAIKYLIEWFMTERCGLQPFFYTKKNGKAKKSEVIFEMCDWQKLYELAAYGGFPIRYSHYSWGLEYNKLMKSQEYGLMKIYEMVINNNPTYAYLLEGNSLVDHKLVIAHVYAHADFFVNNVYFAHTNRKAVDMMANHAIRIREFQEKYGEDRVEEWLDVCLSLDNLIDSHYPVLKRTSGGENKKLLDDDSDERKFWNGRFPAKDYMDEFINPPAELEAHRQWLKEKQERETDIYERQMIFPPEPVRDVLLFLAENAPLQQWQREVLLIVREESYYFLPQRQTKVMNEGWAAYWHSKAMTEMLGGNEIIEYADHNSGTLAIHPRRLNPYLMGREIFRHIEYRWDTHRHGKIYSECDDNLVLVNWDQFVVFKNIYVDHQGDWEKMRPRWNEFLCFWKEIKNGRLELCKSIYDSHRLLRWWRYYLDVDKLLEEHKKELRSYIGKLEYYKKKSVQWAGNDERQGSYLDKMDFIFSYIIPRWRGVMKFLKGFSWLKEAYIKGELEPEHFCIPDGFWSYAQKFPGKLPIGEGLEKIFEVRRLHCDLTFIDEFLTDELCHQLRLFSYSYEKKSGYYLIDSREAKEIREVLANQLANCGNPIIEVEDSNFNNSHKLRLKHHYDGKELKEDYAEATLENLFKIWRRPVYIDTVLENTPVRLCFDGEEHDVDGIKEGG